MANRDSERDTNWLKAAEGRRAKTGHNRRGMWPGAPIHGVHMRLLPCHLLHWAGTC